MFLRLRVGLCPGEAGHSRAVFVFSTNIYTGIVARLPGRREGQRERMSAGLESLES